MSAYHQLSQDAPLLRRMAVTALMLAILGLAAALRFVGLNWDEAHLLHPDERFLSWVVSDMHSVDSVAAYFDTMTSTLNPNNVGHGFYVYGDFPVILTRYVAEQLATVSESLPPDLASPTSMYSVFLIGRALSACFDLLTVVLTFLAARRLFDRRVGLLAAALYAGAAFPIQQAHFFTVDAITNLFVTACFWLAARALIRHCWLDYLLFGLSLGLAMSSKVSIAPLAVILIVALALRVSQEAGLLPPRWFIGPEPGSQEQTQVVPLPVRKAAIRAAAGLVIAGLVTVLVFRVGQPYAFLPPGSGVPVDEAELGTGMAALSRAAEPFGFRPNPAWLAQMQEVRRWVTGQVDAPPNHQWGKRLPLIFPWINMVRVGMGWPLGVFAWLAFAWALWEIGRGHAGAARLIMPVAWIALFFTWQGVGWVTTMRYFLPLYAFLLTLAAWALVTIRDRVQALIASRNAPRWHWSAVFSAGLIAFVLLAGIGWGYAVSRIYTRPVTRIEASRWIVEHVPSDITLIFDTPEGPRQLQLGLPNDWLPPGQDPDSMTQPGVRYSELKAGITRRVEFTVPFDGTLTAIRLNHVVDPNGQPTLKTISLAVYPAGDMSTVLAAGSITDDFVATEDPRGEAYYIAGIAVPLTADTPCTLVIEPDPLNPLILAGATIAVEGTWDDPVPVPIAPYDLWGTQYQPLEFEMALEDTPDKRARMQYILDHADYLTISSNRFYGSLSRNPQRWPMTIAYYRALFSGELGFELVGDFTSRPNIGPLEFNDDSAEEAWTVYDHPRVFVFRKTASYSPERVAAVLNSVDLSTVVRVIARQARGRPVRIPLPPAHPHTGGMFSSATDQDWTQYDPAPRDLYTRFQPLAVIVWWLLIAAIGWLGFPTLWVLFPGLADRGYPLARVFGLLFGAWLVWMLASLHILPWSGGTILLALLALSVLSAALIWPHRTGFVTWLKANRRHIVLIEATMAVLFLVFVLIRLGNPDLWHPIYGGEKPMDMAYFNAVLRSEFFPPYDPWFAGSTINYYYYGFVIVGLPVKLLGMRTTLAYNLILPTLFALTGIGAFSAAYNLVAGHENGPLPEPQTARPGLWQTLRRWPQVAADEVFDALLASLAAMRAKASWRPLIAGMAALLMAVVLGNLDEIRTILFGLAELGTGRPEWAITYLPAGQDILRGLLLALSEGHRLPVGLGEWYWNATRVIPVPINSEGIPTEVGPITEFPFFTFLYADLHAHMIAMPLTLLVVGWGIALVRGIQSAQEMTPSVQNRWATGLLNGFIGALAIGVLRPTNTWDYPTCLVLGIVALALAHFIRRGSEHFLPALAAGGVGGLLLGALAVIFSLSSPDPAASGLTLPLALVGAAVGLLVGFAAGAVIIQRQAAGDSPHDALYHWLTLLGALVQIGLVTAATFVLYLPYIQNYRLGYDRLTAWTGSRTPLWAYVDILGLFLFIIISWLLWELGGWLRGAGRRHILPLMLALAIVTGITVLMAAHASPVAAVAVPMSLAALALFLRPGQTIGKRMALILLIGALALTLLVEVIVLEGDLSRMNTVFKFYIQVWLLMAVVAGAALGWLWDALRKSHDAVRIPWLAVLTLLVLLAALYPLMATRAKIEDRWNPDAPHTLDGMAYMPTIEHQENNVTFSLRPDYEMLRWIQDHITGTPVVLEALSWREYLWGNRVAVYTGLPSVIGWNWHQRQQRTFQAQSVWDRYSDVAQLYNTTDPQLALALLERYHVDLIVVGELERAYYSAAGLDKFRQMADQGLLTVIYNRDNTVIYRVVRE